MSPSLSLSSTVAVLPCPACNQTINTSMQTCPFCSASIDHAAATASAEVFARVNQACSDASYLKIMAWSVLTFFLVMFIPLLGLVGVVGLVFVSYALPVMCIRWWVKYGSIKTADADFVSARHAATAVGIVSATVLVAVIAVAIVLHRL